MKEYISKQQQLLLPANQIFALISSFNNLTPAVADKVEDWQAMDDRCSFKVKGFTVMLKMEERVEPLRVKIVADEGCALPADFAFWIQLQPVSEYDTRFRLVLHVELNMMMKMMIGGKIQKGLDQAVDGIAASFAQAMRR